MTMEPILLERIRDNLVKKREGLAAWLRATPPDGKEVALGPAAEGSLEAHMQILEDAIQKTEEGSLGECEVCHESVEPELLEMDYTACVCITHFSEQEIRNLENELELAQEVQRMLLPQEVPDIPGVEIAAFTRPAQIVGGDYFDFLDFDDRRQGIAIADVAGHGVAAGLHMASVQSLLRALIPGITSPAEVAEKLNRLFIHNINYTTFVSFFVGSLDVKRKTLIYCNAGHNPPLLLRESQQDEWLSPTGPAVGLVEEAAYKEESLSLGSGDVLLLYTDGVTEAINPQSQEFGAERLRELVRQDAHLPAQELIQHLRIGLEAFTEGKPPDDDLTIVLCKIL
jgi:sigma-B regulation protein RsbU (phosphoserine phosphatase)